jgi:hypothetical protein
MNRFWVGASKIVPWGGTGQLNSITSLVEPFSLLVTYPSDEIVASNDMDRIDDKLLDRSVTPQMLPMTVTISSSNWTPSTNNIAVFFDGLQVQCSAAQRYTGTLAGTLQSDANGVFTGIFTIPSGLRVGRKLVLAQSLVPGSTTEYAQASAIFASEGLRQVYNSTYVSITVVGTSESSNVNALTPTVRAEAYAQVFTARRDVPITGIILYFQNRPTPGSATDRPISVQIRDLDINNQPTSNILAQVLLTSSLVNPSLDSSAQTIVTFDDPVFLEAGQQYAIVLSTDSSEYSVFQSRLGNVDYLTQQQVIQNPDTSTVWRSQGGLAYSSDAYATLKFQLQYAIFNPTTTSGIVFKNIVNLSSNQTLQGVASTDTNVPAVPTNQALLPNFYSKFLHSVTQYIPPGARIIWSYSINNGVSWTPYTPNVEVDMGGAQTQLQIKCAMDMQQISGDTSGSGSLTPASAAINLNHNGLVLLGQQNVAHYMQFSTNIAQPCSNITLIFVTDQPIANASPFSSVTAWYSVDGGVTYASLDTLIPPTQILLQSPFYQRTYDGPVPTFNKLSIRIDINNDINYNSDPQVRVQRVIAY